MFSIDGTLVIPPLILIHQHKQGFPTFPFFFCSLGLYYTYEKPNRSETGLKNSKSFEVNPLRPPFSSLFVFSKRFLSLISLQLLLPSPWGLLQSDLPKFQQPRALSLCKEHASYKPLPNDSRFQFYLLRIHLPLHKPSHSRPLSCTP